MILGVMSDTHGNRKRMHRVADQLVRDHGATLLFHLGDDYGDGEELAHAGHNVRFVPGLWCDEYRNPRIPKYLVETVEGLSIACAHTDKDIPPRDRNADIVLTGHTHVAALRRVGRSVWLNPGHLKPRSSRGERPSYAIIEIEADAITCCIHEVDGTVRTEACLPRKPARGS